jgi:hypothetical protein
MVAVAVVAAVVAVVAVAAPVIVAAAPAIVAGGAAVLAGGAATAAVSTAALTTVAAVAATTAAVAIAVAATATVLDNTAVWDPSFSGTDTGDSENGNLMPLTNHKIRPLTITIAKVIEALTFERKYYFAYRWGDGLVIKNIPMTYLEAYAFLVLCGFINKIEDLGIIAEDVLRVVLSQEIQDYANDLRLKKKHIFDLGFYTEYEIDAAALAYAAGGFYHGLEQSELHFTDNPNGSYYYHFHDVNDIIHVWYGNAYKG